MGTPLNLTALESSLRHLVRNFDTYMDDHLERRGMWPALTKAFAESYEELLKEMHE